MQVTIQDLKNKIIEPILKKLPYEFNVLTDTGVYQAERIKGNIFEGAITSLVSLSASEIAMLSGQLKAVAMNVTLSFLIPLGDNINEENTYNIVQLFRENLESVFGLTQKLEIVKDEKHYVGAVSYGLPMGGELLQRQGIGNSFEYICYLQFSFLENAVNSSDVQILLNGEQIPYASFSIARRNSVSAALVAKDKDTSGEAGAYAENSSFAIDLTCPLLEWPDNSPLSIIPKYLAGKVNANETVTITIKNGINANIEKKMILSEVKEDGAGLENVTLKISFIPYIESEDDEEDET